jgi:hypothetical protein
MNKQGKRRKPLVVSQNFTPVKHTFCGIDLHFLFSAEHEPNSEDTILLRHPVGRRRLIEVEGSEFGGKNFKSF